MHDDLELLNKTLETWVIQQLCRGAMLQNSRQTVPVTDTENLQNHSCGLVRIVPT